MNTVVLIGTSHGYQTPGLAGSHAMRQFIEGLCARYHVRAIAEEMTLEALSAKNASESVGAQIAAARDYVHRYCDPDSIQRKALGIPYENEVRAHGWLKGWDQDRIEKEVHIRSHAPREKYWADRLSELDEWPVLFICGANHVEHFEALLRSRGNFVEVAARDWTPRRRTREHRAPKR